MHWEEEIIILSARKSKNLGGIDQKELAMEANKDWL
jgi:hypothetical protein